MQTDALWLDGLSPDEIRGQINLHTHLHEQALRNMDITEIAHLDAVLSELQERLPQED